MELKKEKKEDNVLFAKKNDVKANRLTPRRGQVPRQSKSRSISRSPLRTLSKKKKGVYFSMDALLGALLLVSGILIINQFSVQDVNTQHIEVYSRDVMDVLNSIKIEDVDHQFVRNETDNGNITNLNDTVLLIIGKYWANGEITKAQTLTQIVIENYLPDNLGFRLSIDDDIIYTKDNGGNQNEVVAIQRMVSGIQEGAPVEGITSFSYLRRIRDKRTSSFAYFGGFVGQGNLTINMQDVPSDVTPSDVTELIVEMDTSEDFNLTINGVFCDQLIFAEGNQTANLWNVTHCNSSIIAGTNVFELEYTDTLNTAFVGGGYIKLSYKTDQFLKNLSFDTKRYYLPGIDGVINLYDSFYVPGNLTNMTIYLHYLADHSNSSNLFYLTIGNDTVFSEDNSTTEQFITITDSTLSNLTNYSLFDRQTVPIRIGFENLTFNTEFSGNADVSIVTDVSGSMAWHMYDNNNGLNLSCDNINDPDISRMSVARCLDKDFVTDILNYTGNTVGLVAYQSTTTGSLTVNPTTNETLLNTTIDQYEAGGGTCICCGILDSATTLTTDMTVTEHIDRQTQWNYSDTMRKITPSNDTSGNAWYMPDYEQNGSWTQGNAAFGYDDGSSLITLNTVLTISGVSNETIITEDNFGSFNSSADTFGIGGASDGWDWDAGTYGYETNTNDYDFNGVVGGELEFDVRTSPSNRNNCGNDDCSAAYGIDVVIDAATYNIISSSGGKLIVSFDYEWDGNDNPFETSDEVWIKARWTSPTSGTHYLGSEQSSSGGDSTLEVARTNNPDNDFTGSFSQDITDWVEGPGTYYFDFGGKLRASSNSEWGDFRFDNLKIAANNETDSYYFRKEFNIADIDDVGRAFINFVEDDFLTIYLNGNVIYDNGDVNNNASYWTEAGVNVLPAYFVEGRNVVAAKLVYSSDFAGFDMELKTVNNTKIKAMMVMTDGQATRSCAAVGVSPDLDGDGFSDTDSDDAIQAACNVAEDYGILTYAVGYSDGADEPTLEGIANCGQGVFAKSDNVTALETFYSDVVFSILEAARQGQSVVIGAGSFPDSILYPDSYIEIGYDPIVTEPEPGQISLAFQTPQFDSCDEDVFIYGGLTILDARVTSYSGEHWTDLVTVNDTPVFNLSIYDDVYDLLGDPYIVDIPADVLVPGQNNTIGIRTGDNINDSYGCSLNNSLIYTATIDSVTPRTAVVESAIGCNWEIEFEDGSYLDLTVPPTYSGANNCTYNSTDIVYNNLDSYDVGVFTILDQLDFDKDGRVLINIQEEDLEIVVTLVSSVPYLWGPSLIDVRVWQ